MRVGLRVLSFAAAACASTALAQDIDPRWTHGTGDVAIGIDTQHVAPMAHPTLSTTFPAIEIALQGQYPRVFEPNQAVGNGGFVVSDNSLLHEPSGLVCPVSHVLRNTDTGEDAERVYLFRVVQYRADGGDVSCAFINESGTFLLTSFASNWPDISLEEHVQAAAYGMQTQETPITTRVDIPVAEPNLTEGSGIPGMTLAFAYDGTRPNTQTELREALWLNSAHGWHVKVRATHSPPAQTPLYLGMFVHATALNDVSQGATSGAGISNRLVQDARPSLAVPTSLNAD